mgnify:CR=1 FL=1
MQNVPCVKWRKAEEETTELLVHLCHVLTKVPVLQKMDVLVSNTIIFVANTVLAQDHAKSCSQVAVAKENVLRSNAHVFLLVESVTLTCVEHAVWIYVLDPSMSVIDRAVIQQFNLVITNIYCSLLV